VLRAGNAGFDSSCVGLLQKRGPQLSVISHGNMCLLSLLPCAGLSKVMRRRETRMHTRTMQTALLEPRHHTQLQEQQEQQQQQQQ
jgi:hypothetical protein